ncbi:zf-TFIIB domain-containing protein [Legionella sp. CNM-1927-20]|uniref:TFIIB-type zinc ribbon-containing protein n=1 Tax=Legionella sp. CNM-1927-20 TaxID=3422221 RepID=UPI00403AC57D
MQCPVCQNSTLQMSERQGVEIDYCQQCRGVWLDRGELDKIIERMTQSDSPHAAQPHYDGHNHKKHYYKKRKSSFLSDLFDF